MKKNFYAYLDDFNLITVIVPHRYRHDRITRFILRSIDMEQELAITSVIKLDSDIKYCLKIHGSVDLKKDYHVVDDLGYQNHLQIGRITKTKQFDEHFFYDGPLGFEYHTDRTFFRVWTPVAKEVILEWIDHESVKHYVDMVHTTKGVWMTTVLGDLERVKYRFLVRTNIDFKVSLDPYALSSTANAKYNYVIDPSKLVPFKHPVPMFSHSMVDAVIYEAHIRDMTIDQTSGVIRKGKYLGLLENSFSPEGNSTGLDYIKELGITHLQLLPIYDFDAVDEKNPDILYNWGYNPEQYNVPEGWFSSNPDDPYARINELRMLIDNAHARGIRVNMDVVYNHVYDAGTFPFEKLVPNYFYRVDKTGEMTNASGCGNDIATEMAMARKFIVDSLKHWQQNFRISGFRFDLMGLIDIETMNRVVSELKSIDPQVMIYGEGWNIPTVLPSSEMAHMFNHKQMKNIAFFNDKFRDTIKGSTFGNKPGFSLGNHHEASDVRLLMLGSAIDQYLFEDPSQSINYVECHDNHTFYDKMSLILKNADETRKKHHQRLAISMVLLAQGIPFLHAGQEFMRTKQMIENSYRSNDDINKINWFSRDIHNDLVETTKDLISIRKEFAHFRLQNQQAVKKSIHPIPTDDTTLIGYKIVIEDVEIHVLIKNDFQPMKVHAFLPQDVLCIFDGFNRMKKPKPVWEINLPGIYLFKK